MGMKGLELPLNMIVLIIMAVLVLLVVAAVFTGYFGRNVDVIGLQTAFSEGCNTLRSTYNCANNFEFPVRYQEPGAAAGVTTTQFSRVCVLKGLTPIVSNDPLSCGRQCGCTPSP